MNTPEYPIIVLTEHFEPSTGATAQLVTDLVADMRQAGIPVQVLTSTPAICGDVTEVDVLRISKTISSHVSVLAKTVRGLHFLVVSFFWLFRNALPGQTILIVSNPPFIGIIGLLLKITNGVRYTFLLQDVFPRSAILTGLLPARGPAVWFWNNLISATLLHSSSVITLTTSMLSRCKADFGSSIPFHLIHNWSVIEGTEAPSRYNELSNEWGLNDLFTIQYSGNFGRLHDLLTVLEAARLLSNERVMFVFIGDGPKLDQIRRYKAIFSMNNVMIKPFQPRSSLSKSLMAADISLVSMIPGADDTVAPSKLYGLLSMAKPILLVGTNDSALAHLIRESRCGIVVSNGDPVHFANEVRKLIRSPDDVALMGRNSRQLYINHYGRTKSTNAYIKLLQRVAMN